MEFRHCPPGVDWLGVSRLPHHRQERVISQDAGWPAYLAQVRYRLFPGLW